MGSPTTDYGNNLLGSAMNGRREHVSIVGVGELRQAGFRGFEARHETIEHDSIHETSLPPTQGLSFIS